MAAGAAALQWRTPQAPAVVCGERRCKHAGEGQQRAGAAKGRHAEKENGLQTKRPPVASRDAPLILRRAGAPPQVLLSQSSTRQSGRGEMMCLCVLVMHVVYGCVVCK